MEDLGEMEYMKSGGEIMKMEWMGTYRNGKALKRTGRLRAAHWIRIGTWGENVIE